MSVPVRARSRCVALAAGLVLAVLGVPTSAAPAVQGYIVQATSASAARAAVQTVLDLNPGVGSIGGTDLTLVDGVVAQLSTVEVAQLPTGLVVSPDAPVRPTGFTKGPAKPPPAPVNVFRQVTGASAVTGNTGQGAAVAVVDTGIAALPDFAGRLEPGVDLSGEGSATLDSFGHGTFVAGLVAGGGASNSAYVGEAPGARLVPVKVAGASGDTTVSNVVLGLQWIAANPGDIRVVNLSLGAVPQGPTQLNPLDQAVEALWHLGFVVVTSAGNNGSAGGTVTAPGDDPLVVTVGALDDKHTVSAADDAVAAFSSHGATSWDGWWKPDLLAPGKSLVSVIPTSSTVWQANPTARVGAGNFVGSGTSFSAAVTSGAAAMLLTENPAAQPDDVKAALLTTTDVGPGKTHDPFAQGHGVLDVARAVAEPLVTVHQDASGVVPPVAGAAISLKATQLVSSWASGGAKLLPVYPLPYPYPYSGPATTVRDPRTGTPLFQSTAWNSTAWNSTAWNSTAWNSTAWNSTAWNSTAWNSTAWNSTAWN